MGVIISGAIYCPLCEAQMKHMEIQIHAKRCTLFICSPCHIGIYDFDPAFNKWRDTDKDIPCPHCGYHAVKWFARYMDGFFMGKCPKCKTVLKKDGDVRFNKNGAIILPEDMEPEEIEQPVEIKIPLHHLIKRLGKEKIDAFKAKLKRSSESRS